MGRPLRAVTYRRRTRQPRRGAITGVPPRRSCRGRAITMTPVPASRPESVSLIGRFGFPATTEYSCNWFAVHTDAAVSV